MKNWYRILAVLLLVGWSSSSALAQSSPPPNPNYTQYNTKADGDIPTPPAGKVRLFYNGTGFRFKTDAGTFTDVGGAGITGLTAGKLTVATSATAIANSKWTMTGTNLGTATLYDDTATVGVTSFVVRAGAGQASTDLFIAGDANQWLAFGAPGGSVRLALGYGGSLTAYGASVSSGGDTGFLLSGALGLQLPNNRGISWTDSTNASGGSLDIGLARSAAGILKVTDGSTGSGGIGISDAATNTVTDALILRHNGGTVAAGAGFGTGLLFQAETTTTNNVDAAQIQQRWEESTHATRESQLVFSIVNSSQVMTDVFTVSASLGGGSVPGVELSSGGYWKGGGGMTFGVSGNIGFEQAGVGGMFTMLGDRTAMYAALDNGTDLGLPANQFKNFYVAGSLQGANSVSLTAATDDPFVEVAVPSGGTVAGYVEYALVADDATDYQARAGRLPFSVVNKGGTETAVINTVYSAASEAFAESAGASTLAVTFTTDNATGSNNVRIRANAVSSLTETTLAIKCRVVITSGTATLTFNP